MNDQSGDTVPDDVWNELVEHCDERQRAVLVLWIAANNLFNTIGNIIKEPAGTTRN